MEQTNFFYNWQTGGGRHGFNFYDVICIENLFYAWKKFKKGKRSKKDVAEFEFNLEDNIFNLHNDLAAGIWKPDPYIIFFARDPKLRKIHKATVRDRVLYQAVYQILYQVFDKSFIHDSYASRDSKGTHKGIERFEKFSNKVTRNHTWPGFALKCDIRKFFDSIDHKILISLIQNEIHDEKLMTLIVHIIDSFHAIEGRGLPLGNVTSQIMANIYLNELDQFIKHKIKARYYIRYCDDFVVLHRSKDSLDKFISEIKLFLMDWLRLQLHPNKVSIEKLHNGIDFLGYVSLPYFRILRTKTNKRMFKNLTKRKFLYDKEKITKEFLEQAMQSYLGALSHCKSEKIKESINRLFWD